MQANHCTRQLKTLPLVSKPPTSRDGQCQRGSTWSKKRFSGPLNCWIYLRCLKLGCTLYTSLMNTYDTYHYLLLIQETRPTSWAYDRQAALTMYESCLHFGHGFFIFAGAVRNMQDPVGLPRTRGCSDFGSCEARRNTVTLNGDRSPNPAFSGDEDPFTNYFDVHLGVQGFEPYPSDPLVDDSTRWLHHVGHRNRQASPRTGQTWG